MDELLAKLLESEILSADTKKELEEAFNKKLDEATQAARKDTEETVRTELVEKWVEEKDTLIEALDTKVGEYLNDEMAELKVDIERFRDLEAEHAEKLVEARAAMAEELKGDMTELVEAVDAFLEMRLAKEIEELHEDIDCVKKLDFGRKIFEGIAAEYKASFVDADGVEAELHETRQQLNDTMALLAETEKVRDEMERAAKLEEVLEPLEGRQHEVMEAILANLPTDKIEEGYKAFIGRVLRETEEDTSEKEDLVLAEGSTDDNKDTLKEATVVTGDLVVPKNGDKKPNKKGLSENAKIRLRTMAGLGKK